MELDNAQKVVTLPVHRRHVMKSKISGAVSLFLLLSLALMGASNPPQAQTDQDKGVIALEAVISQVRQALIGAQKQLTTDGLPPLASIDLTLKSVVQKQAGGTFKLWIISFGVSRENDQTQTVTIHLTPPTGKEPTKVGAVDLTAALQSVIVSAAEGAHNAGTVDYPLEFSGLTVELDFTVQMTGNAGVQIPQIIPISADLSGKVSKNATQTVKVVFGKTTKPANP